MRYLAPLIFGVLGAGILLSLGIWQMQRLEWKEAILAEIDARIVASPIEVPSVPDRERDRFLSVAMTGRTVEPEVHVLVSTKQGGAGYRVITAFETNKGRRLLLDRGIIRTPAKAETRIPFVGEVTGNIHWPDERDSFTPEDDVAGNIWFARDVAKLSAHLRTEPVFIVARSATGVDGPTPFPVSSSGIPNDHLGYAVTWFGLALVWVGMTFFFLWRMRRPTA